MDTKPEKDLQKAQEPGSIYPPTHILGQLALPSCGRSAGQREFAAAEPLQTKRSS
jgi:hypothetical protein